MQIYLLPPTSRKKNRAGKGAGDEEHSRRSVAAMGKRAASSDKETTPEERESMRLKRKARSLGLLSDSLKKGSPSRVPRALRKYNGMNINNKASGRGKRKFLFLFPGRLDIKCNGGRLGTLAKLSTRNPVLYIEYPQGRMKLLGTIIYPKCRFLAAHYKKSSTEVSRRKAGLRCNGTFDAFIVFSEHHWVGTAAENPSEKPLPIPEKMLEQARKAQEAADKKARECEAADAKQDMDTQVAENEETPTKRPLSEPAEADESSAKPLSKRASRRSGRSRSRVSYKEMSSGDEDEESQDDESSSDDE